MTTPIDPTKIRPGDKVTFHEATVICTTQNRVCVTWSGGKQGDIWLSAIASVTPAPREFKPGDSVVFDRMLSEILAIHNELAWIKMSNCENKIVFISTLRYADDGAAR